MKTVDEGERKWCSKRNTHSRQSSVDSRHHFDQTEIRELAKAGHMRTIRRLISICLLVLAVAIANKTIMLLSAGSTFIYPIVWKWSTEYRRLHPEVQISYEPLGSSHGIARTMAGTVDFGASDDPMTDAEIHQAHDKIVEFPAILGAVVPTYNLPGITQPVRFTPAALSGIYLGRVTRWNDPELLRANPGLPLPSHDLAVVFRTDGSGTTYIWTDYLSKVSDNWRTRVGRGDSVTFPVGIGAQFNQGVEELIKKKPYTFGYLEVTYAVKEQIQVGLVQNASGRFVEADSGTITAAAKTAAAHMPNDFRVSITNATGLDAYPISSFSWLLVPEHIGNSAKCYAVRGFLRWILTDGQKFAKSLYYAPLPPEVASRELEAVDRIQ